MADKMTIRCAWCDVESDDPGAIVAHMLASGHGLGANADAFRKDCVETALPGELERVLSGIQDGSIKGEPVVFDDDDQE
jgi:hypothetical protein